MKRSTPPPSVVAVFAGYPPRIRRQMMVLRALILDTAAATAGVGAIEETLKWGEPAYLTPTTKSGSTIRIAWKAATPNQYAVYFICTTGLVERFRTMYPHDFTFDGNRALVFDADHPIAREALAECIATALTYHRPRKVAR